MSLRNKLIDTALQWQERFGVAPSITSAISEYDAALLVGMTENEYSDYMQDKTAVSKGADFTFNKTRYQVKAYPYVFTDGSKKKTQKNMVAIGKSNGKFASYIAECGLETIFQKCLLSHLFNNLLIHANIKDWRDNLVIEEWHGTAMFGTGLNNWQIIQNTLKMQIEFQGGSFKVVLISNNINNYKGNNKEDYNKIFDPINGQWVRCFVNNKGNWTPNTKSNKPRISLTKPISKDWYYNEATFVNGFNDAIQKAADIINDWCTQTGNPIP